MTPYYDHAGITIYHGDALKVLRSLPDEYVQCCVTSPPYWGLRDYGVAGQIGLEKTPQEYVEKIVTIFREVRRVLNKDGTLWLNMGDLYAGNRNDARGGARSTTQSRRRDNALIPRSDYRVLGLKPKDLCMIPFRVAMALQADGWWLRSCCPWLKRNGMPESCKDRPAQFIEYIFLLSKSSRYFYDHESVKIMASPYSHARYGRRGRSDHHKYADGGPGGQTIARSFEHMVPPGVNPKAQKPVSGWMNGPGSHRAIDHNVTKDTGRKEQELGTSSKFGRGPGWRNKQNTSFSAAVKDVVTLRARRNTDWFFESWQGLLTDDDGDPLAFIINPQPYKEAHFATFPPDLVKPCILAGSMPGDVILDPFGGSMTTAYVAKELGRKAVMIELKDEYIDMGTKRLAQEVLSL